jgi:hypothetical protein
MKDGTIICNFWGVGGNLWARRVYTWKFPDFSGHVYSILYYWYIH